MMAGIALAPETPAESVFELVEAGSVDTVLLLSVRPGESDGAAAQGAGGISFIALLSCCCVLLIRPCLATWSPRGLR